jgi:uncharacterized membrane protein
MVMNLGRILKHVAHTRWKVRRAFPEATLAAIGRAVAAGERQHAGEVRFVIEGESSWEALLAGQSPRQRAIELFAREGVWDTEANNGVLVYVSMADRCVEVVADRGFNGRVAPAEWQAVCSGMERSFRAGEFETGAVAGVAAIHALVAREFPSSGGGQNELPDRPKVL